MDYIQIKLRNMIAKEEERYNIAVFFGWSTEVSVFLRHLYLKALLKEQLKNFNFD